MKIFAALQDDMHQGWVWLQDPQLPTRCVVKITNPANRRSIYCEALQIERNFLAEYNQARRISISNPASAIVMGHWFRAGLGGLESQSEVPLIVTRAWPLWGHLKACMQHPQIVVRIATWLGLAGLLLGVTGALLGLLSICRGI